MTILDIPYVSQLEAGARMFNNDCGAASGVMLVRAYTGDTNLTVDDYYRETGQRQDRYLSASQIRSVLNRHSIPSTWRTGVTESDARMMIDNKRPFIVLYNYRIIRERGISTQISFNGYHFAVLVGLENSNVYLHDPLWSGEMGKNLPILLEIFLDAWSNFPIFHGVPDNPPRGALIPDCSVDAEEFEMLEFGDPTRMRVIFPSGMNVRFGPGTNFSMIGTRNQGDVVNIYETKEDGENLWGCMGFNRWIAIKFNNNTYLVPDFPGGTIDPEEHEIMEIENPNGVIVRKGPAYHYPIVNVLLDGERIKVYKRTQVEGVSWGRIGIDQWIPLTVRGQDARHHIM